MLQPYQPFHEPIYGRTRRLKTKAASSTKMSAWKRTAFVVGLPALLFVGLVSSDLGRFMPHTGMRKLVLQCVHNIYADTTQMALDMPQPPVVSAATEIPSYMAICQEWIRREAQGTYQPTYTQEDDTVCLDWTSPHYRVLEIVASSILDRMNGLSRYRHDCYRSRVWDEAVTGMDRVTIQQLLPVARMSPDEGFVNSTTMKAQCKVCLDQFDPSIEKNRVKSKSFHQCLTWPEAWDEHDYTTTWEPDGTSLGMKAILPQNASNPNVVPLTTVWKQIRNRVAYVAKIMSNVTDHPPDEQDSGVVIYIDAGSIPIDASVYQAYFPDTVTSISVLASPLCATAYLSNGQLCTTYAEGLVSYFQSTAPYSSLTNTGFKGLAGVKFQMAASSAGLWSRMILAKRLICAPNSPNCLIPAGSKVIDQYMGIETDAIVLDPPGNAGKAVDFFTMTGHGDRVTVIELLSVPATVPAPAPTPLYTSNGDEIGSEMAGINEATDAEGYPSGGAPPAAMSQADAAAAADTDVYADAAASLPSNADNPNVYFPEVEKVPNATYAQAQHDANLPINLNYNKEDSNNRATDEMTVDADYGMTTREYTAEVQAEQSQLRAESEARIKLLKQEAKAAEYAGVAAGEAPPSMEMEVYCPEVTDDGYNVAFDAGAVEITKNDHVIVSDGAGTATFHKDSMTKENIQITRDPTTSLPYTHIYDPVSGTNYSSVGTNITVNNNNGVVKRNPVGVLLVDNTTNPYKATLITEGGTGTLRTGNTQNKYSGEVWNTDSQNTDKGSVVRQGRGYGINYNIEPGVKRTIEGTWNTFYSNIMSNAKSGYQGSYNFNDNKSHEDDPEDLGRDIIDGKMPHEVRRLGRVSISVPIEEWKRFGERRVCHNNKGKVLEATRRAKELAELHQLEHGEPIATAVGPSININAIPNEQIIIADASASPPMGEAVTI